MSNNETLNLPLGQFTSYTTGTLLGAFETEGLDLDKYIDVALSVIYLNQKRGSNQQKLTIERAMSTNLLSPLVEKVSGVGYSTEKLPDIQEFRLLFDSAVIFYACKSSHRGKLKELIKEITGEDRIHLTIDSSRYLLDILKCRDLFIETDSDLEEGQINNHKKLLDEMAYLVHNKWEKKEEEVEETDDQLKEKFALFLDKVDILHDWNAQIKVVLAHKFSPYASTKIKDYYLAEFEKFSAESGCLYLDSYAFDNLKARYKDDENFKLFVNSARELNLECSKYIKFLVDCCYYTVKTCYDESQLITLRKIKSFNKREYAMFNSAVTAGYPATLEPVLDSELDHLFKSSANIDDINGNVDKSFNFILSFLEKVTRG